MEFWSAGEWPWDTGTHCTPVKSKGAAKRKVENQEDATKKPEKGQRQVRQPRIRCFSPLQQKPKLLYGPTHRIQPLFVVSVYTSLVIASRMHSFSALAITMARWLRGVAATKWKFARWRPACILSISAYFVPAVAVAVPRSLSMRRPLDVALPTPDRPLKYLGQKGHRLSRTSPRDYGPHFVFWWRWPRSRGEVCKGQGLRR